MIINQGTPGIFLVSTEGNAKSNECGEHELKVPAQIEGSHGLDSSLNTRLFKKKTC